MISVLAWSRRTGPGTGSPRLANAIALSLRLHTPMLVTWTVATAVMGLVFGAIAPQIGDLLDSPSARRMMERLGGVGALQDTLIAAELSVLAVVVSCFAITVVGHGGTDETDGRTEQVLATATSRAYSFLAILVVAFLGATWLLLVTGVAVAIGYGAAGGASVGILVASALAQAPAVWVMASFAAVFFAVRSSWNFVAWGVLVAFVTLGSAGRAVAASFPRARPFAVLPRAEDARGGLRRRTRTGAHRARRASCRHGVGQVPLTGHRLTRQEEGASAFE